MDVNIRTGFDNVAQTEIVWPALTAGNQLLISQHEAVADLLIQLPDTSNTMVKKGYIIKVLWIAVSLSGFGCYSEENCAATHARYHVFLFRCK